VPEGASVVQIYLYLNNKEVGPFTEEQIRVFVKAGAISQTHNARREGVSEWQPLNTIVFFGFDGHGLSAPQKKAVQTAAPLNILVVDDEKSTGKAVCYVLEHAGNKVDAVHDGQEALQVIKTFPDKYQLLITDHMMLKMTGLELVEKLQQTQFHGKIIVFTGYLTADLESAYRLLGVKYYFNKPLDLKRLPYLVAKLA
jgi:CheY-like chemotaxis protein